MKRFKVLNMILKLAVVSMFMLSGSAYAESFKRIKTENQFKQLVVGKKLRFDKNYVTIKKNGHWSGKFWGEKLSGVWEWKNGYWCRTIKKNSYPADCQTWSHRGKEFKLTREKGKGRSFIYVRR